MKTTGQRLDLESGFNLSFEPIDINRFNAISLARQAYRAGAGHPTVLNAANEMAVEAFLAGKLRFDRIENISAEALQKQAVGRISGLEDILALDAETRHLAQKIIETLQ